MVCNCKKCSPLLSPRLPLLPHLIDRREWRANGSRVEAGPVLKHPAWGPVPAPLQAPAGGLVVVEGSGGGLVSVQRAGGGLVPAELCAALTVAVRGAGVAVQAAVLGAGAGGQPLGDVLGVAGRAPLGGAAMEDGRDQGRSLHGFNQVRCSY